MGRVAAKGPPDLGWVFLSLEATLEPEINDFLIEPGGPENPRWCALRRITLDRSQRWRSLEVRLCGSPHRPI